MKFSIIISAGMLLLSCQKSEQPESVHVSTDVIFAVRDADGNDLLDPVTPGAFDEADIDVFYYENGEYKPVYEGHLDYPKSFMIINEKGDDFARIKVFVDINHTDQDGVSTTLVGFGDNEPDTIRAEIIRSKNGSITTGKVWLNGSEIADRFEPTVIVK